ncbi:Uncharacterised protein [Mycobacteroides abscessus subsp. abscessus]|nr:Uncharacterised protein [Mycobacteroides abscessus subsp. abscessus]
MPLWLSTVPIPASVVHAILQRGFSRSATLAA